QAIIAEIEHVLVAAEHRRVMPPGIGEQRTLNQKAGWHLFRFTREDNARAIDLLRRAIAQNPDADRRHQGLSLALGLNLAFGWAASPEETIAEMVGAAERSVSLREEDAWNHAPLCWSLLYSRQFERAIASAGRMIELNPNSGVSYGVGSLIHAHCGDPVVALDLLDRARHMAPQAPFMFNYLTGGAIALCRLARFGEAADMAESAGLRRPNYFQPPLILAAALANLNRTERAAIALSAARRNAPPLNASWLRSIIPLRERRDFDQLLQGLHVNDDQHMY
ncbi:MAG: tetratricopeptide repeat protein, partial [Dongiaceae bacterium]